MQDRNKVVRQGFAVRLPASSVGLVVGLLLLSGCDDGSVRFGLPGGLRVRTSDSDTDVKCESPVAVDSSATACDDNGWPEVFALFNTTYGCTLAGPACHGGDGVTVIGAGGLSMPAEIDGAYQALKSYTQHGRSYIDENKQESAYILCNLNTDPEPAVEIGSPMPITGVVPAIAGDDLVTIATWVACGMLREGGTPGGGAGGGGAGGAGVGGMGGAGG